MEGKGFKDKARDRGVTYGTVEGGDTSFDDERVGVVGSQGLVVVGKRKKREGRRDVRIKGTSNLLVRLHDQTSDLPDKMAFRV